MQVDVCHHSRQHRQAAGTAARRALALLLLLLPQAAPLSHTVLHRASLLPLLDPLAPPLLAPLPKIQLLQLRLHLWGDMEADAAVTVH